MKNRIASQPKLFNNAPQTTTFLPYGCQSIDEEDIQSVVSVLKSEFLTQGPKISEFEDALCRQVNARHVVAVNSGTSALHIACLAAGLKSGDEAITSAITFVASANSIVYCGARPVFCDINPKTYNLSPEDLEKKITKHTKVIIPVHFAGQSCDMEVIQKIVQAKEKQFGHKIYVIEDASHALGSQYQHRKVGSCTYSDMTTFSFHPVKHITTGEGGAVTTGDAKLWQRLKQFRSHGITSDPSEFVNQDLAFENGNGIQSTGAATNPNPWYYEQINLGFNYRITDIQCALGISQLKKLLTAIERRRSIINSYNEFFKTNPLLTVPDELPSCQSNFHLYVLLFDFQKMQMSRAEFMRRLKTKGIQTQVHYIPVHLQPFFRSHYGTKPGDCPNAEAYYKKCLSIPLFPAMTHDDVGRVREEIQRILQDCRK